ncbi:MAG: hypothetical protein WDM77_15885 [Steroidobacteraceae bacterium]
MSDVGHAPHSMNSLARLKPESVPEFRNHRSTVPLAGGVKARQAANKCDRSSYGIQCHMKALLAFHDKQVLPDGAIVEKKIWEVATPVAGSAHKLKYGLFYGARG